eukprot:440659-Pleurochrysis_carterae.AAC.1
MIWRRQRRVTPRAAELAACHGFWFEPAQPHAAFAAHAAARRAPQHRRATVAIVAITTAITTAIATAITGNAAPAGEHCLAHMLNFSLMSMCNHRHIATCANLHTQGTRVATHILMTTPPVRTPAAQHAAPPPDSSIRVAAIAPLPVRSHDLTVRARLSCANARLRHRIRHRPPLTLLKSRHSP